MSSGYEHRAIEKKWQERWEKERPYAASDSSDKKKTYLLIEFPYPSGDGLHVGHIRSWTALDVVARKRRMQGENVLYPIGWDAFGLPAENYAIKTGIHPTVVTKQNTDNFRRQIKAMGISFDWDREVNTTDPAYYKWTQWIFLQLYKKGLAYKAKTLINWCPKDKIGLANEEVIDGACERCGTPVEKREKEQWMLAITKYAQRLFDDLDKVDYIEAAKAGQRNWIGPSEGAELQFSVDGAEEKITVFTTRPDTLFGATYLVLAPEHPLVETLLGRCANADEVRVYAQSAKAKSDIERGAAGKEKTGVELKGVAAVNPINKERIPVFIADYVLGSYGTGAIMAVPAHDERDYEFAKKYGIPVRQVVVPCAPDAKNPPREGLEEVKRDTVIVHLRDASTGKFAVLDWHGSLEGITTAIMGGVEEGQTPEEAALAEIREEAGLEAQIIGKAPWITAARYCASHKNQNRCAHAWGFIAEVANLEGQKTVAKKEAALHTLVWVDEAEVAERLVPAHQKQVWQLLHEDAALTESGYLINSGPFDGMDNEEAKKKIAEAAGGRMVTTYKLRDWVFSRQRYWGEPIPMVRCEKDGWVPVPEANLPVELPNVERYEPTDTGESPLANISEWVTTTCPNCGGPAKRETDVMPNWAGSSWYYLRYTDVRNDKAFASKEKLDYWTPVDWYNGGMEHTTLHLLYSRFWHKFLFDEGLVPTDEPYLKRTSHGLILAEGGEKMSKSKGNTVSPDALVEESGADALRLYEMFIGPFDQPVAWSTKGIAGTRRFLERAWKLIPEDGAVGEELDTLLNQTIKKVGEDIESLKMNTAVSSLMILLNELEKGAPKTAYAVFLQLLAPFAPHVVHELAAQHGVALGEWPAYDASKLSASVATIAVQVNGKVRATLEIAADAPEEEALAAARVNPSVKKWLEGKEEKRAVYVKGKIISFSTT